MGMFDWVYVYHELPDGYEQREFQTKDLDSVLDTYTITAQGSLVGKVHERRWVESDEDWAMLGGELKTVDSEEVELNFHGDFTFHTYDKEQGGMVTYLASFDHGRLNYIRRLKPRE